MNTNIIIGILVVVIIGAGVWLTFGSQEAEAPKDTATQERNTSNVESDTSADVDENFSGTGSFAELMQMGQSLTCDFSYEAPDTDGAVAGTMQVSGERMRGDFEMMQAGQTYHSHMIHDGEYLYTWSDTPQGTFAMRMPATETEVTPEEVPEQAPRPVDLDSEVSYDCRPWSVDSSVFVPPSDVEFMDQQQMMQGMMQMHGDMPEGFDPSQYQQ